MLVDDPDVRWPDAVLPGSAAARRRLADGKAREAEIEARRAAAEEAARGRA